MRIIFKISKCRYLFYARFFKISNKMEETEKQASKLELKTWGGWVLTIILSVLVSWGSMDTRVSAIQSEIAVLKTRVVLLEKTDDRQQVILEKQVDIFNDIKVSLIEIKGNMNLKQDKYN